MLSHVRRQRIQCVCAAHVARHGHHHRSRASRSTNACIQHLWRGRAGGELEGGSGAALPRGAPAVGGLKQHLRLAAGAPPGARGARPAPWLRPRPRPRTWLGMACNRCPSASPRAIAASRASLRLPYVPWVRARGKVGVRSRVVRSAALPSLRRRWRVPGGRLAARQWRNGACMQAVKASWGGREGSSSLLPQLPSSIITLWSRPHQLGYVIGQ